MAGYCGPPAVDLQTAHGSTAAHRESSLLANVFNASVSVAAARTAKQQLSQQLQQLQMQMRPSTVAAPLRTDLGATTQSTLSSTLSSSSSSLSSSLASPVSHEPSASSLVPPPVARDLPALPHQV